MPSALVEYGDYECPHCKRVHGIVKELRTEFLVEFRNFPLTSAHPRAQRAAEAAEAARSQGRFWEMHDLLFEHQDDLSDEALVRYAGTAGLDTGTFIRDLEGGAFTSKVREDFREGVRAGVNGTPTFFVSGVRHEGPVSLHSLRRALHAAGGEEGTPASRAAT